MKNSQSLPSISDRFEICHNRGGLLVDALLPDTASTEQREIIEDKALELSMLIAEAAVLSSDPDDLLAKVVETSVSRGPELPAGYNRSVQHF